VGVQGKTGAPVVTLAAGSGTNEWVIPSNEVLTAEELEQLEAGQFYINAHIAIVTRENPAGRLIRALHDITS